MKWLGVISMLAVACELGVAAQIPASSRPASGAPPFQRPSERPAGLTPEIQGFLRKLVSTYQTAERYRDTGRVTLVQRRGRVTTTTETPLELAFQRPNLLRLEAGHYTVVCDGKTLVTTIEALEQFTATRAPAKLEKAHLAGGPAGGGSEEGHPDLLDFLIRAEADAALLAQVRRIAWRPDVRVNGVGCRVLFYETIQGTRVTMCVDAERMVVTRVEAEAGADHAGGSTRFSYELGSVQLNPAFDAASFAFEVPNGFRRVNRWGEEGDRLAEPGGGRSSAPSDEEGGALVGKPAPAFTSKDLSGAEVALADLKGKVVLLFFWSLSGGEHCLRAIPVVQQVAERFRDRPEVVVLGVSPDVDNAPVVRQLLERKQARFRTLLDEEMRMQRAFGLGGVPTFVIIGPSGEVRYAKLGAPPLLKEELAARIERVLAQMGPGLSD